MSTVLSSAETNALVNLLVIQAQSGDSRAFCALVERHQAMVRTFLGRYLRDPGSVDDLAQETFLTAHRRLNTFRADSQFSTWLLGIARHLALTFLRDEARRQRREGRVMEACVDQWQVARLTHDEPDDHQRMLDALSDCLETLSDPARELVEAFYFHRERAEAIAERTNRKSGSIRMALLRIRNALGECVRNKTELPGDDE
ncbi:MAG: sigma-70 family RNA polymerase sigma factor [Planctomycetales bacterium]|nr:sigma-70 family RNA polymerase sigma factor [Planctomycetales bacterium]